MWFKKEVLEDPSVNPIPPMLLELFDQLHEDVLLLSFGEFPIYSSSGVENLNILRDGRLVAPEILAITRAVRRNGIVQTGKVEVARGPIGEGTRELTVRVLPLQENTLIAVFLSDESEAQRVHEVRRDFVANISHELKTPIGALSLLSEAVLSAKDDPDAVLKFASRMQMESKRLTDLVQEIINLSRLQDSDPMLQAQEVSINDSIQVAVDQCQTIAFARKIEINYVSSMDALVLGDVEHITMAIHNLIENAINYSPENTSVTVSTEIENGIVQISITDQGIGIPEADQSRIFERFYRVDAARSRETGGTGLGLSIVKHVISNHGGDIQVWSAPGTGSTFTVLLPIVNSKRNDINENEGERQ